MSLGNLKDQGNQGKNTPYQIRTLQQLGLIEKAILTAAGADRELRITTYQAIANGGTYSIGDIITRTDIIDVVTSTIVGTIWFNESTGVAIPPVPIADITPYSVGNVTVTNPFNLEATQLLILAALTAVVRTPSLVRATGAGNVAAGARSVSVFNAGAANGLWLGVTIKPGEQLSYSADGQGDTLSAFSYDGTGTELVITSVV